VASLLELLASLSNRLRQLRDSCTPEEQGDDGEDEKEFPADDLGDNDVNHRDHLPRPPSRIGTHQGYRRSRGPRNTQRQSFAVALASRLEARRAEGFQRLDEVREVWRHRGCTFLLELLVVGAGVGRTGTHSLKLALEIAD